MTQHNVNDNYLIYLFLVNTFANAKSR